MLLPSPGLDLAGLADAYAGRGWVQMPDAFDREGADRLHEVLSRFPHWELFLSDENGKPEVLNAAAIAADREGVARKMEALRRRAGSAFGYQYLG